MSSENNTEKDKKEIEQKDKTPDFTEMLGEVEQKEIVKNFNETMSRLGDEYFDTVAKLAEQDKFQIELKVPTGGKIINPVTNEEEDEFKNEWETTTIKKGKITAEEFKNIEILRGRYNNEKADKEKEAQAFSKLYNYIAYVYFGMNFKDIKRANWDQLKPVLDSANFATVYSMKKGGNVTPGTK